MFQCLDLISCNRTHMVTLILDDIVQQEACIYTCIILHTSEHVAYIKDGCFGINYVLSDGMIWQLFHTSFSK